MAGYKSAPYKKAATDLHLWQLLLLMVCCENQRILLFVHQDATGGSFSHGSGHSAGDRTAEDAGRASDKAGHTADDGNTYIVPMISGQDDYEAVYEVLKFDKRKSFVYDKDG